jgi:hypothetical protein
MTILSMTVNPVRTGSRGNSTAQEAMPFARKLLPLLFVAQREPHRLAVCATRRADRNRNARGSCAGPTAAQLFASSSNNVSFSVGNEVSHRGNPPCKGLRRPISPGWPRPACLPL